MSTYIEALILLSKLIEVSVWLVHTRVAPLAQRSVLLVIFGGRGEAHFALQAIFIPVQGVQDPVSLDLSIG